MKDIRFIFESAQKREEFFRELRRYFAVYYGEVGYSEGYTAINGITESDSQGSICYLENRKKTFLRIEEFNDCILIEVVSNSKRTLSVLKKFLSTIKHHIG